MHSGSCLCGAVSFDVSGPLPMASACHCSMCRKNTGNYEAGVDVKKSAVTIKGGTNITWFRSSEKARRGFCSTCGSPMFFEFLEADLIGLMLGAFDGPTGVRVSEHIFVGNKGDYYDICDGARQYETVPE
ncbi:GFA family protein [Devosia sp. CAU 1758]